MGQDDGGNWETKIMDRKGLEQSDVCGGGGKIGDGRGGGEFMLARLLGSLRGRFSGEGI